MEAKTLALYLGCKAEIYSEIPNTDKLIKVINSELIGYVEDGSPMIVKPILRPLKSITVDEAKECNIEMGQILLAQFPKEAGLKFFTANQFQWFLSKGFDLFGLIEKGYAIAKVESG